MARGIRSCWIGAAPVAGRPVGPRSFYGADSESGELMLRLFCSGAMFLLLIMPVPALAHEGSGTGGFIGGFSHPLLGPDHIVAMVAVGLWGAFLGAPAIWTLPIVFPLVMAGGGVLGIIGFGFPGAGVGIAGSGVALRGMVGRAGGPPTVRAPRVVGAFAVFHGHAHGAELPPGSDAVAYSAGFVIATGLLHLTGISFGLLARWPAGRIAVRLAGIVIAVVGAAFLSKAV